MKTIRSLLARVLLGLSDLLLRGARRLEVWTVICECRCVMVRNDNYFVCLNCGNREGVS